MTRTPALLCLGVLVCTGVAAGQSLPQDESCITCHRNETDERLRQPALDYPSDLHAQAGLGCLACHGNPALGRAGGFLAKPERRAIPELCGSCHSDGAFMRQYNPGLRVDQVAEYRTSVHGQLLAERGDTSVAVCVNCHPAHRIRPASDPESSVYPLNVVETCGRCHGDAERMAPYGIPTNQPDHYRESVHWTWMVEQEDLTAPTCNDCHGNHGASPPGVSSVRAVCGQCHSIMEGFFRGSQHDRYFVEADMPGCAACHGNHAIQPTNDERLLGVADSVCTTCHTPGDSAARVFHVVRALIDSLARERDRAHAMLAEAENRGMEVSEAQFRLEDATNALVQARTAIHAFRVDSVEHRVAAGLVVAAAGQARGAAAIREYLFRRQGLAVSVVLILLLIAGLIFKIRELDRNSTERPDGQ
jgi:hypothetical protein